jgi:hypothetical protein
MRDFSTGHRSLSMNIATIRQGPLAGISCLRLAGADH